MASAGRRQIFGSGTSITKSRRWRPQINDGGSAGTRLYLKDCYPIHLLCLLLLFSSSGSSSPLLHPFPSPPLLLLVFLFSSSSLSSSSPPSPHLIIILLLFPPLLLFLFPSSSFPPPLFSLLSISSSYGEQPFSFENKRRAKNGQCRIK